MGWVIAMIVLVLVYLVVSYLPAIVIFLVLDRYRPGLYTPRRRWLRMAVYLLVIWCATLLLRRVDTDVPWLLNALVCYGMPVPLYYLLRRLF